LGSGTCSIEYLTYLLIGVDLYCLDYDIFYIENAKKHFKGIHPVVFNFITEPIEPIVNCYNIEFAYFCSSSATMNDTEFVSVFRSLKKSGVKSIIDFTGCISLRRCCKLLLRRNKKIEGQFHSFYRTKNHLRKLYRKAGWNIAREFKNYCYNYIVELK
jgi:hypothetical protein